VLKAVVEQGEPLSLPTGGRRQAGGRSMQGLSALH